MERCRRPAFQSKDATCIIISNIEYKWLNNIFRFDREHPSSSRLIIQTDFSAQYEMKSNDSICCEITGHANLCIFIVRNSPRSVKVRKIFNAWINSPTPQNWDPLNIKHHLPPSSLKNESQMTPPSPQAQDKKTGRKYNKTVTTNDVWHFWMSASGKNKDNDFVAHNASFLKALRLCWGQAVLAGRC